MRTPVYLDNQATTAVDSRVLQRMLPFFSECFGNAASRSHSYGWRAEEAVEVARKQVAALIGGTSREIVFVSGATESNNAVLFGVIEAYAAKGDHVITQATEHKSVLDASAVLAKRGCDVTVLGVDAYGRVSVQELESAIRPETVLVSVMLGNNEVGTLQPIAEIGAVCRRRGVLMHTDAVQGAGRVQIDVNAMNVDLASLSAHKMYGPKGVGALYVRRRDPRVALAPLIHGGGHERGMRSGTLNVPGIVGFGEACRIAKQEMEAERVRIEALRDSLHSQISSALDGVHLNGHPTERLPGNLHVSFDGLDGETLLLALRDLAVSSGSACTSATREPSYVLRAMGVPKDLAHSSIRFGLGRFNTQEEVDFAARLVIEQVQRLREIEAR